MNEEFENICVNCGELFISDDEEATYCQDCWDRLLSSLEFKIQIENKDNSDENLK